MNNVTEDIQAEMRLLPASVLNSLKKACHEKLNISVESAIWLLVDVFSNGHVKSHCFDDAPSCVIDDGLIVARHAPGMSYVPYALTEKAREILKNRS